MIDKKQNDPHLPIDIITFYTALFYKLAKKNNFTRKDFQDLIIETYNYLPARGGGLGEGGFWENICKTHDVPIIYTDGELDERVIMKLADALWLPYDQDIQNEAKRQKKLDLELANRDKKTEGK